MTPVARGVVRGHVVVAIKLLRERIADPWTLDALAEEVHLSRSQLVRSFDAVVGTSPMAYLRQMRVKQMARLLASTDLSIGETARSVGWKNQFHASQCFHAAHGMSPSEYRRQYSADDGLSQASGQKDQSPSSNPKGRLRLGDPADGGGLAGEL